MNYIIIDFIEQNWDRFVEHCKDNLIPESEIEKEFEKFQRDLMTVRK